TRLVALDGMPDLVEQVLDRTLANDRACQEATKHLEGLARDFDRLAEQNRKILARQGYATDMLEEMLPVVRNLSGLGDFAGELRTLGASVADISRQMAEFRDAVRGALAGRTAQAGE